MDGSLLGATLGLIFATIVAIAFIWVIRQK